MIGPRHQSVPNQSDQSWLDFLSEPRRQSGGQWPSAEGDPGPTSSGGGDLAALFKGGKRPSSAAPLSPPESGTPRNPDTDMEGDNNAGTPGDVDMEPGSKRARVR